MSHKDAPVVTTDAGDAGATDARMVTPADPGRRRLLGAAAAGTAAAFLGVPSIVRAQVAPKIRIGYWPVAAGLPFFAAIEKGYFKEAGLDVEPLKFAGAQQVMEAMLAGRSDGSSNGTGSANLGIGEIAQPGLFKIFCTNPSNAKYVLDEFIIPKDSPVKTMADLKGKRIASGPGIQNVTLCKTMLERAGATGTTVIELPIGQHVASIAAGQVDACYTLEPTGTIGRLNGTTRVLEAGVVAKYILGDPLAPWHGGSASLTTEFIKKYPEATKKVFMQTGTTMMLVSHDLEEAVYLADEVLLLTKRPTKVAEILKYDDPRPRTIATLSEPSFIATRKKSLEIFQREVRR